MNTTHLVGETRWYKTRKPRLQLEILACLATKGELSKSMVESILKKDDHHDIVNSFKKLENSGFIKCSRRVMGRGRPQGFFIITEKGLSLLITDDPTPWKFWRALMGYCYYNSQQITLEKVREFYHLFVNNYLKYSSEHGYGFNLNLFNQVSRKWVQSKIQHNEEITLDQRILETLALCPGVTLEQLAMRMKGFDGGEIKAILFHYIAIPHKPAVLDDEYIKLTREGKITDIHDFYLHNMVVTERSAKGIETYELSLFGVMLALTLIRWNDMNRLKPGLHYNISFEDYYHKIASNYRNKLPLIFNKWYLLKRTLKVLTAYNFDIILDEEFRYKMMGELSVKVEHKEQEEVHITSGNKELFENSRSILAISGRQLGEIQIRGLEESRNFIESRKRDFPDKSIEEARSIINKKTEAVSHLIWEITVLLDPLSYDAISFKEEAIQEWKINSDEAERLSRLSSIETIEKPFADEISFLYYLNLNDERLFHVMHPMNYYSSLSNRREKESTKKIEEDIYSIEPGMPLSPKRRLLSILHNDEIIRGWFSRWIKDLEKYQEERLNRTRYLNKEIETTSTD